MFGGTVCAEATVVEAAKGPDSIGDGLQQLLDALAAHLDDEVIVFGYSRGAQIIGRWLARYADAADAPDPDRVSFEYDSWCDWPAESRGVAGEMAWSTLLGVTVHLLGYLGADLDHPGRRSYNENTTT